MAKRRRRVQSRDRFSSSGVLIGLAFLLIVGFLLLDFLYKREVEIEGEVAKRVIEVGVEEAKTTEAEVEVGVKAEAGVEVEAESPPAKPEEEEREAVREVTRPAVVEEEVSAVIPPRVAIIVDDLGHSLRAARPLFDIEYPLTLAILPGLRHSLYLAERMNRPPFEIILHLPLEPEDRGLRGRLEQGTIMVAMSEEEVRGWMEKHLEPLLPYISGVNTHMGSKATTDKELMKIVLEEVKKRGLYFVDSYTTDKSVALEVARSLGLRTASRRVFLDSGQRGNDPAYIRGQIEELAKIARKEGQAIGIGHPNASTLKVLQEMMPKLAEEGILFVTASEVVE